MSKQDVIDHGIPIPTKPSTQDTHTSSSDILPSYESLVEVNTPDISITHIQHQSSDTKPKVENAYDEETSISTHLQIKNEDNESSNKQCEHSLNYESK